MHSLTVDFKSGVLGGRAGPCLSLYQPTHRHHPDNQQDSVRFRNLTRALRESLQQHYGSQDATALLEPFDELATDAGVWKHTQSGLAVLAAPGFFRVYRLLRTVPERAVVADSFHVKPLLRIMQSADAYHVLMLNRREIRLFEGNRDALEEIDLVPGARTITEALGHELTEPHLTVASYGGAGRVAQRHGHGSKSDEIDVDRERYFRAVDRSILEQYSRPSGLPLILAALSEYHAPFHSVSQNPYLLTEGVQINPGALSSKELCAHAWRAFGPRYFARLHQLVERFGAARGVNRGGANLPDIAAAAIAGRVATILIEADRVVPGRIEEDSGGVAFGSLDRPDMDDVLDDLGELVLRMGGEVVVVPVWLSSAATDLNSTIVFRAEAVEKMLISLTIAGGLILLAAGGELLVRGSAQIAARFGVSSLVIGLTVVAFGTSAPEVAVSLQSISSGASDLAVGNVLGSNIFNVLFILGASAVVVPLVVSRRVVWIEVPVVIGVSTLAWCSARDGRVASTEGWVLLLVVAAYLVWLLRTAIAPSHQSDRLQRYAKHQAISSGLTALAGLGLLVIGARWLVDGATSLALTLGISDAVIGLTVVAAGTSLPEVAASLVAAVRGHRDIAVGNILGSNIFNLTIVLGTATVVAGELHVPEGVVTFDLVIMVAVAVACLPIFVTGHTIARWEGALFLAYYAAYTGYLVLDATDHERLPHLRDAMAFFALPLTAVTLLVLAGRALWSQRRADPGPM